MTWYMQGVCHEGKPRSYQIRLWRAGENKSKARDYTGQGKEIDGSDIAIGKDSAPQGKIRWHAVVDCCKLAKSHSQ